MAGGAGGRPELRITFVEMLFALTVAEIAVQSAEVAQAGIRPDTLPAITHLLLASLVVATSWIGWARSGSAANMVELEPVISWSFVVLLLDVLLVVFYFILVRGVELPHDPSHAVARASAHHESAWIVFIFAGYCVWDVVTKLIMRPPEGIAGPRYWPRAWPTILCFGFSILVLVFGGQVTRNESVVAVDVGLLLLVLCFRSLKEDLVRLGAAFLLGACVSLFVARWLG